jgi:lipoprotein NlpI
MTKYADDRFRVGRVLIAVVLILAAIQCAAAADDRLAKIAALAREGHHAKAIALASDAIDADPRAADAYYLRARSRFCNYEIPAALADFDRYIELRPQLASRQWERGIACYYAGEFKKGAEQFELYQTYHDNDVENSVWRFLCLVPLDGLEKARTTMLPIRNDRRIPMMQVYQLYRGELSVDEVFAAIDRDQPNEKDRAGRMFYARLYVGLYYEALGNEELAKKYILQAAEGHRETESINRYMWAVADVHARKYR